MSTAGQPRRRLGFKRHFVWPGLVAGAVEIIFVLVPLHELFRRTIADDLLYRVALPVLAGAQLVWWLAVGTWLSPTYRAIQHKRRGQRLSGDLAAAAYRTTVRMPLYALVLRTGLWAIAAATIGFFLIRFSSWTSSQLVVFTAAATMLAFAASVVRSFWYQIILVKIRAGLFSSVSELRRFSDSYLPSIILTGIAVSGATAAAAAAFVYFSLPIDTAQFLSILAALPVCTLAAVICVTVFAVLETRPLASFLRGQLEPVEAVDLEDEEESERPGPTAVYRLTQALPYRLATVHLVVWLLLGTLIGYGAHSRFQIEFDDSILLMGIIAVIAIGTSLYQSIWNRDLIRPLLDHLTVSHRLPVRGIRPTLSLRGKLLLSFGGMVLFACTLALFWGFIQYKKLVTDFTGKQAELGLDWLRSEVIAASASRDTPPTPDLVGSVLRGVERKRSDSSAVFYYMPREGGKLLKLGGGLMGAPTLPWYAKAQLELEGEGKVALGSHSLSGRRGRLEVPWHGKRYDLGVIAVFYPNYRGRGVAVVREVRELLLFFLVLFGACAGIVMLTVAQFVKPIRRLEKRADGMARGELAKPVSSGGEGDEIGRLTFALEEMRRALREKLRSTEEVNLDLERAVQRRTADLAKKNRELAETLEKLTRAQDQLVRSEKMASIGQLVAGIAHEINNPVNAIVNTVGPLSEVALSIDGGDAEERAEAMEDIRHMLRVVRRGAERTKAIVQALHNYSRTDEESVVDVDLNRSLDDSLELLRHLLKQSIRVERHYGEVGRIRGHAGQLNQVFVNLIANAAQAVGGRDDAAIVIETEKEGDSAVIRIRDNGEGIPADVLPRIFDPFFTTKDVGQGSGLGLSIVHGIVERHGGRIEVDSVPGVGTTFTIALPGSDPAALAADTLSAAP